MILKSFHIGLTVSDLNRSIDYYTNVLKFKLVNDEERKGEWVDRITGISGFHTRTAYLAISPHTHFELFEFYNPKSFTEVKDNLFRSGLSYCIITKDSFSDLSQYYRIKKLKGFQTPNKARKDQKILHSDILNDPDDLFIKIVVPNIRLFKKPDDSNNSLIAVMIVKDIQTSSIFYQDILGLHILRKGFTTTIMEGIQSIKKEVSLQWVEFGSIEGVCLKLIKPIDEFILPAYTWHMERIGFSHFAFAVRDIEKYYYELNKKQVIFKSPPQDIQVGPNKGGMAIYLEAPEGATLEFIESPITK